MSVENFPFSTGASYILSALYLLESGSSADLVPRCKVARKVALARSTLIPNRSDNCSGVARGCLSLDWYVALTGTS